MPSVLLTPNLLGRDGISRLSRLIARARDDVSVVSLHDDPSCTRFEHARVCAAGGRRARFLAAVLRGAARAGRGTMVIAAHVHLAPAAMALGARGASLVTVLCGIESWAPLTLLQRAAVRRSRLVAISSHTASRFRAGNPSSFPVDVCHPGIEDAPQPGEADPAGPPRVLIVGRMSASERYKGHDALLEIWPEVIRDVPEARLEIVGEGDDRLRLEAKAGDLGLARYARFAGRVDEAELARRYQACTAFAMPSRNEGFGFVFLEAMRAGRACIGAVGAASEIIDHERTGLLVEADDPCQLRYAIVRLLRDRPAAAAMGTLGRRRFEERFTEMHFRARLAALLGNARPDSA